ncbi:MAG: hypothetical protein HDR51_06725 [Treponema sp.]|nr:hypothetical protein [Treponema sp.]
MKKRHFFMILALFQTLSLFADMIGNKPSIDFVLSPEISLFVSDMEGTGTSATVVANGTLKTDFKFVNFLCWDEGLTWWNINNGKLFSENIFGIYLKNTYSAGIFLNGNKYFDIKIGGGVHGQFPLIPFGLETGVSYSPVLNDWFFDFFCGGMGQHITTGIRGSYCFSRHRYFDTEFVFAWNFKFDIRKSNYKKIFDNYQKEVWIPTHTRMRTETVRDIAFLKNAVVNSNKNFGDTIFNIPITIQYYEHWDKGEVIQKIAFTSHKLGNGEVGTEGYITYTTEEVSLPFYTDEEKRNTFDKIVEEYNIRQEQKARIAENRRLRPNDIDYQDLPILSMPTMGIKYAPNPLLVRGKVYIAEGFRAFYVINRMEDGTYNIGSDSSLGGYQFILRNTSGESIRSSGYVFTDTETAYLQYLGTTEVIMSDGRIRYLPYFEMLKKNPHETGIRKIINECKEW